MISSCGHDERNQYWGGTAGDQSGTEWYLRSYYRGGWDEVLIHPDKAVREAIARVSKQGALNQYVGYDQYQRLTFYGALKAAGWDASRIAVPCEADCSSSTAACVIAAGHLADAPKLRAVSPALTTWSIGAALVAVGFKRLTGKQYLQSEDYLPAGTIINRSSQHVVIQVTDGARADETVRLIGGYDSSEEIVNDNDKKAIAKLAADEVWAKVIGSKRADKRLIEASDDATNTKDPTGRNKNLTTHNHVKWIAAAAQETKNDVSALKSQVSGIERKLDWLIEKIGGEN